MSVLQVYQAELLKELDEGEEFKAEDISVLRRTADLALRANQGDHQCHWALHGNYGSSGEASLVDPLRHER